MLRKISLCFALILNIKKHRNKAQVNFSYQKDQWEVFSEKDFFNVMFQVEIGI